MDGDRIGTLYAGYLLDLVKKSKIDSQLGIVRTAYAHGGSMDYIENVLIHECLFVAHEHGTIVSSENARESITNSRRNSE